MTPEPSGPEAGLRRAVSDIGRTALGIFKRGDDFIGRTVGVAGEHLTGQEYAGAFSEFYLTLRVGDRFEEPFVERAPRTGSDTGACRRGSL